MQSSKQTLTSSSSIPLIQSYAFTPGDNKAVKDVDTGLVWLNFGINNGLSFNEVLASLNTTYKGWRLPTESEVKGLWSRLFNSASVRSYEVFDLWKANKTPRDNAPFTSWGYFLDSNNNLANAFFYEKGDKVIRPPQPNKYYENMMIEYEVVTNTGIVDDHNPHGPFNQGGTEERSTLLVKIK